MTEFGTTLLSVCKLHFSCNVLNVNSSLKLDLLFCVVLHQILKVM